MHAMDSMELTSNLTGHITSVSTHACWLLFAHRHIVHSSNVFVAVQLCTCIQLNGPAEPTPSRSMLLGHIRNYHQCVCTDSKTHGDHSRGGTRACTSFLSPFNPAGPHNIASFFFIYIYMDKLNMPVKSMRSSVYTYKYTLLFLWHASSKCLCSMA